MSSTYGKIYDEWREYFLDILGRCNSHNCPVEVYAQGVEGLIDKASNLD